MSVVVGGASRNEGGVVVRIREFTRLHTDHM